LAMIEADAEAARVKGRARAKKRIVICKGFSVQKERAKGMAKSARTKTMVEMSDG
jgi:hypothetical protein